MQSVYSPEWWWSFWSSQAKGAVAPQSVTQPILPGWTFGNMITVTESNSKSPETERAIVAEHSYGRELGRLMDAVAALIAERPKDGPRPRAFDDLLELRKSIEKIKSGFRTERVEADLAKLKVERPEDYRRIASTMAHEVEKMPTESPRA